jgi:hypothetical protein
MHFLSIGLSFAGGLVFFKKPGLFEDAVAGDPYPQEFMRAISYSFQKWAPTEHSWFNVVEIGNQSKRDSKLETSE